MHVHGTSLKKKELGPIKHLLQRLTRKNLSLEYHNSYQKNLLALFPWTVLTLGGAVHLLSMVNVINVTVWGSLAVVIVLLMFFRCVGGLKMKAVVWLHLKVVAVMRNIIVMVVDGIMTIEMVSSHAAVVASVVQFTIVRQEW